jgi:hypothetical protein
MTLKLEQIPQFFLVLRHVYSTTVRLLDIILNVRKQSSSITRASQDGPIGR